MSGKIHKAGTIKVRKSVAGKLRTRKVQKKSKPDFRRQEGWKGGKLDNRWRKPKGRHSKLRLREKARGKVVSIGYGSPADVRGLNRQGYREVRVSSVNELGKLDPKEEMAVISSTVGRKKREELLKLATEKKIHVSNA